MGGPPEPKETPSATVSAIIEGKAKAAGAGGIENGVEFVPEVNPAVVQRSFRPTGGSPDDAASAVAPGSSRPVEKEGENWAVSPWLCVHIVSLRKHGVEVQEVAQLIRGPRNPGKRGCVLTFSKASCRRLRKWLLRHDGPDGATVHAYTLTVPGKVTPDEWRYAVNRWSTCVLRRGGCAVWRVELQRRQVPHLHVILWAPEGSKAYRACMEDWLDRCLPDHCREVSGGKLHAVKGGPMPAEDSHQVGWFGYLVAHSSKHKAEQLGWKGRPWGIVGRSRFRELEPMAEYELNDRQRSRLERIMRKMLKVRRINHRGG